MDLRSLSFNIGFKGSTAGIDKMNSATDKLKSKITGIDSSTGKASASVKNLNTNMSGASSATGSLTSGLAKVAAAVMGVVGAGKLLNISDQMASSTARINLMNDGLSTTKEVQDKIFAAALDTHSEYFSMADAVGKLGITTGAAFSGTDEILSFVTQVNKQFAIGGTSAEGQSAAMLQLTQAMASGALRGDELNSIYENAPTLIKSMADYMGVPVEQMRSLSEEGKITTDVIKNGVLGATEKTNAQFEAMGLTFGKVWTDFKTRALRAFDGTSDKLNEIANSPGLQTLIDGAISAIETVGPAIAGMLQGVIDALNSPAMKGFVDLLGTLANNILPVLQQNMPALVGLATAVGVLAVATNVMAAAQWALNIAMSANPIGLIILGIVALIAGITYLWNTNEDFRNGVIAIWTAFADFFSQLWTNITTGLGLAWASIVEIFTGAWDGIQSIWSAVVGFFTGIVDGIGNAFNGVSAMITGAFDGAMTFLQELPSKFLEWGADMVQGLIDGIKSGITAVGDAVKSVADKISSFLHFSRPDVGPLHYYESWMPDMMDGLAKGIYAGTPKVEQATSGVSTTMAGNLSRKASISGGSSGNVVNLSPVFQVSVGESANAKGIVSDIEKEFYKFMERYSKELELRNQPVYV